MSNVSRREQFMKVLSFIFYIIGAVILGFQTNFLVVVAVLLLILGTTIQNRLALVRDLKDLSDELKKVTK